MIIAVFHTTLPNSEKMRCHRVPFEIRHIEDHASQEDCFILRRSVLRVRLSAIKDTTLQWNLDQVNVHNSTQFSIFGKYLQPVSFLVVK